MFSFGTFFRYFFTWFTNRSTFKNSRSCMADHLDQIILLSYFVNINLDPSCVNISPFWGELPKLLADLSIDHCWLFHYSPGISKDSLVESLRKLSSANHESNDRSKLYLVESRINFFILVRSLFLHLWVSCRSFVAEFLSSPLRISFPVFWPLLYNEWHKSCFGPPSYYNILIFLLYQDFFRACGGQKLCLYLMENQGWETAMLYSWRATSTGHVLGFPHSTVRHWDLRYSYDSSILNSKKSTILPDYIGITGGYASKHFIDSGFDKSMLVDVEALRYQHLDPSRVPEQLNEFTSVVFIGDISVSSTLRLLDIADSAQCLPDLFEHVYFKCHPCLDRSQFCLPRGMVDSGGLSITDLLLNASLVVCTPATSVSVEALAYSAEVFTFLDPLSLNLSPLRGLCTANTFYDLPSFLTLLRSQISSKSTLSSSSMSSCLDITQYFFFDEYLSRWNRFLSDTVQ